MESVSKPDSKKKKAGETNNTNSGKKGKAQKGTTKAAASTNVTKKATSSSTNSASTPVPTKKRTGANAAKKSAPLTATKKKKLGELTIEVVLLNVVKVLSYLSFCAKTMHIFKCIFHRRQKFVKSCEICNSPVQSWKRICDFVKKKRKRKKLQLLLSQH